jgi:hypothetical protein
MLSSAAGSAGNPNASAMASQERGKGAPMKDPRRSRCNRDERDEYVRYARWGQARERATYSDVRRGEAGQPMAGDARSEHGHWRSTIAGRPTGGVGVPSSIVPVHRRRKLRRR